MKAKAEAHSLVFGTGTYRAGAQERIEEARGLKEAGRFALSMYVGGLAVEGMLRSLCCLRSREFDEKHDLKRLAARVGDLGLLKEGKDEEFQVLVKAIAAKWRNTLRYADEKHLGRFLRAIHALRAKTSSVKTVCGEHYDQCSQFVRRCEVLWQRSHRQDSGTF